MMYFFLILSGILIVFSAALSTMESAAFGIGQSRVRTLTEEGFRGAKALVEIRGRAESFRVALFLLSLSADLASLGLFMAALLPGTSLLVTMAIIGGGIAGVLTFGEIVPRAIAGRGPVRVALSTAPILLRLGRLGELIMAPLLRFQHALSNSKADERESAEEREVREITSLGQAEGVIEEEEHLLIERAFRLDELAAWDVMTPRVDIFAWKDSTPLSEVVEELESVPFSRVPVYAGSIDDITGILYVREAYETYVSGKTDTPLSEISREPFFIPGSLKLTRLLKAFQGRRIHMGIVADEFGGTDGLVTLEDVLEELVGEIVDETDVAEEPLSRVSETEILAYGGVDLREINDSLKVSLPLDEQRSLNGFILDELGRVPNPGELIERSELTIEILDASDTQVVRAKLTRAVGPAEESAL